MIFEPLGSQDIRLAIANKIKLMFPNVTVFNEHLPSTNIPWPNFQVLILSVNRRQASKLQIRDEWDNHNIFFTIIYRIFDGLSLPPRDLLARLHNVGYILVSYFKLLEFNNTTYRIRNSRYELSAAGREGLMNCQFYANIDVLLKTPAEPQPLQQKLEYQIETANGSIHSGSAPRPKSKP